MSIGQYVDRHIDRWTGQYPILAYATWRDLNQSQPHISIRGITKLNITLLQHTVQKRTKKHIRSYTCLLRTA